MPRTLNCLLDALGRIDTITDSDLSGVGDGTFRYAYVGPSRLLNRTSPNGTRLTLLSGPGAVRPGRPSGVSESRPAGASGPPGSAGGPPRWPPRPGR
jgi:hypothetical protein